MPIVIQRVQLSDGVVVYQSRLLRDAGVPHAFSTRIGGVSTGSFTSMNLGNPGGQSVQDSHDNIAENYHRLQRAIGCAHRKRYFAHQVHGATVLDPHACPATDSIHGAIEIGHGDALVTDEPNALLSVRVADCVPVLMSNRAGTHVSAVHAGWRGVAQGAVVAALDHFDHPYDVIAAIGPSIGLDAFEVGAELLTEFTGPIGQLVITRPSPKGPHKAHIDLRETLRLQLIVSGVPVNQIEMTDRCTVTHADEFFSHRRENGLTGRMAAMIGVRA